MQTSEIRLMRPPSILILGGAQETRSALAHGRLHREATTDNLVTVHESPIHGHGLFAAENLSTGEAVLRLHPDRFANGTRHPWNRHDRDILPFFLNHSCVPNVAIVFSERERAVVLIVTRPIARDEEVTLDYATVEIGGRLVPCACGSDACRGAFPSHRPAGITSRK